MKKFKNLIFYISTIAGFSALIYWIIVLGSKFNEGRNIALFETEPDSWNQFIDSLAHNLQHPLALLLAQIVTIILVARLFGWVCNKIGQPTVIGEMIAGIMLGPSFLGMHFPDVSAVLFPMESLGNLQFLSQIGLILFMFIVGMELDLKILRNKAHDAVVISHASIIFPFALGMGMSYFLFERFAPDNIEFSSFGLFIGIAMSVTAFPVLARIVQERGIQRSRLGTIVITCAAADDITAWCILAAVIAIVKAGSFVSSLYVIVLAVIYVIFMIKAVRPFLKRIGDLHSTKGSLSKPIVAIFFIVLILSSYATEVIGIHALFGAFMAGAIMPESAKFRNLFIEKVEDVGMVLLLPLFFVFTGLRTQIGLLNDIELWKITGLIIVVAVVGKFVGSALAAKFVGQNWKDSLSIGALMNTRGLMELVVLNIGYDLGVLSPEIFAMMVIMALVTTFMTGPAMDFINWAFKSKSENALQEVSEISKYKILISFGNPERGRSLLKLADGMIRTLNGNASITAMHLSPTDDLHHYNMDEYEKESFEPIIEESNNLDQEITTLFKGSNDIGGDIVEVANKGEYDLLLIGVGHSIFEGSLLGRVLGFTTKIINPKNILGQVTGRQNIFENSPFDEGTELILSKSKVPVGVLIDKELEKLDRIFIPILSKEDVFLMNFAQKFINNSSSQITILDVANQIKTNAEIKESIRAIEHTAPNHISLIHDKTIDKELLKKNDLMLVSLETWKKLVESKSLWLSDIPSCLILTGKD
ncbi:cation:proton antiporter domain-containing protein [Moheibacter sediminis]|uniref:Transporter, CPA2 family n=1 Tax=Moheibacter sediminis TaxID=1434700 RepID=A0A1W1YIZ8_9FLAO|nr:cation:proton antiporter [Moheibacter sediminis]SMC35781.1 transporter, CPA2 family [Moheibacter sediminis]